METEVLIVGAGPTGLMLAIQLARRGIGVAIVDRHSGPAQQSRAMAVHARTMEIYSKLGIVDEALRVGKRGGGANIWSGQKPTARIPLGEIGKSVSPYPFVLMLGQDENERILGEKLRDLGVTVQWNTELTALAQDQDHVTATLRQPDGTMRQVCAAYVAGSDGGRSTVRELCGIGFPGAPYDHVFFVADTEATGPMVPDELNVYLWRDGFHLFFPMHGENRWRVIGILPKRLRDCEQLTFEQLSPDIRREAGVGLAFQRCLWFSTYRIHHRAAERFRDRQCFLLGDAAHVHSPMGGQGMNTGLQDAYNLAWKLALVLRGKVDEALLDTYEAERLPVAQRLLGSTDRAFSLLVSDGWAASIFRTRIVSKLAAAAMSFEGARKLAFRVVSQIGISYRSSPLSKVVARLDKGAPAAGDRFPWLNIRTSGLDGLVDLFGLLDDLRFNLVVVGQPANPAAAHAIGGDISVIELPLHAENRNQLQRVGISRPCFYLLRPDGHVGLVGAELDWQAIARYRGDLRSMGRASNAEGGNFESTHGSTARGHAENA